MSKLSSSQPVIRYNLLRNNGRGLMAPAFPNITFVASAAGGAQLHVEGNRFESNTLGVELFHGVQADLIGNDFSWNATGVLLKDGRFTLARNRITYNRDYGIAINGDLVCTVEETYGIGEPEVLEGEENEIHDNGDDLCPDGYSWPEGFVKP